MALLLLPAVRGSKNERGTPAGGVAHSVIAPAGRCVGPASRPPEPGMLLFGEKLCQGAVAAAQRKQDSSRATATIVTLCGLPRARIRV
jgi:hypothetical protein